MPGSIRVEVRVRPRVTTFHLYSELHIGVKRIQSIKGTIKEGLTASPYTEDVVDVMEPENT